MKKIVPVVIAGFLLAPHIAGAQGYPGLMSPQQGYTPPRAVAESPVEAAAPAESDESAPPAGGGFSSGALPYTGTGADNHVGHMAVSGPGADGKNDSAAETAEENSADAAEPALNQSIGPPSQSSFADSFAPKEKPWVDPTQPKNIYDFVQASTPSDKMGAPARRAQAQADAQLQAQRDEIDRANAERTQQQNEQIRAAADQVEATEQQKQEDAQNGVDSQESAP